MSKSMPTRHIVGLTEVEARRILSALKTCTPSGGGSPTYTLLRKLCGQFDIPYDAVPCSHVPLDETITYMKESRLAHVTVHDLEQWSKDLQQGDDARNYYPDV